MAPKAGPVDTTEDNTNVEDNSAEEQEDQQQETTDDTSGNGNQQQDEQVVSKDAKLPEDHPVVKQLAADKAKLAKANTELAELRAQSKKATTLETELAARPTTEALETLQTRYDRLEAFLQAAGGPLSKALDSRTFTKSLFETDEDIEDIVKAWKKNNPSATAQALGASSAAGGGKSPDINAALRAAAGR